MRHVSTKLKNKRGSLYNTRSTKTANGWSKHIADKNNSLNHKHLRLAVVGTYDTLGRMVNFNIVKVKLKHPTDTGYFKESFILKKNLNKFSHLIFN